MSFISYGSAHNGVIDFQPEAIIKNKPVISGTKYNF